MKEMIKHLFNLLFVNGVFVFLVHKRSNSKAEYNIKLIGQPTNYFQFCAALIGISSAVIAILIVMAFDQNVMVIIAAVFISLGTGRQIFASALDVITTDMNAYLSSWASTILLVAKNNLNMTTADGDSIESHVKLILYSTRMYNLPIELDQVGPESQRVLIEYLNKHKWELKYPQTINSDDSSRLAFAQYATKYMIEKLLIYNNLEDLQERSGGVNAVILIALGTLIWLIS